MADVKSNQMIAKGLPAGVIVFAIIIFLTLAGYSHYSNQPRSTETATTSLSREMANHPGYAIVLEPGRWVKYVDPGPVGGTAHFECNGRYWGHRASGQDWHDCPGCKVTIAPSRSQSDLEYYFQSEEPRRVIVWAQ